VIEVTVMPSFLFRPVLLVGLLMAGVLLSTACGGGDDAPAASLPATGSNGTATKVTDIPAGALVMDQDNLEFKPRRVDAMVGTPVFVKNSESALHTFNVNRKNLSGNMSKGDIVAWTADMAGTYNITCEFHPQMKATITVK
jgi:plastocyanin